MFFFFLGRKEFGIWESIEEKVKFDGKGYMKQLVNVIFVFMNYWLFYILENVF